MTTNVLLMLDESRNRTIVVHLPLGFSLYDYKIMVNVG
jgi:hypothetical protein